MIVCTIADRAVRMLRPEGPVKTVLYTHEDITALPLRPETALVEIGGVDWDADLSPWPAPRAFKSGRDFAGGADAYLRALTEQIVPAAEAELGAGIVRRGLIGYSLAGLFALYALYRTDLFSLVGSVSGSLWYDGFLDFLGEHAPLRRAAVYLSLGDKEARTANARLASVEDCTERARAIFAERGLETVFERNPGGHFNDPAGRVAKGVDWLLGRDAQAAGE